MSFNLQFYTDKLDKLKEKSNKTLQEYINTGIKFGQDINEINVEGQEIEKIIAENTPNPDAKELPLKEALKPVKK